MITLQQNTDREPYLIDWRMITLQQNTDWEPYLIDRRNVPHGRASCRLRISGHDLQIEGGRYSDIAKEDMERTECGAVENELRVLDN